MTFVLRFCQTGLNSGVIKLLMHSIDGVASAKDEGKLDTSQSQTTQNNSRFAQRAVIKAKTKLQVQTSRIEYELRIIRNNMRKRIVISNNPVENERIKFIRAENRVVRLTYGNKYTINILLMNKVDERKKLWALFFVFDKFQMKRSRARLSRALQAAAIRQSLSNATKLLLTDKRKSNNAKSENSHLRLT